MASKSGSTLPNAGTLRRLQRVIAVQSTANPKDAHSEKRVNISIPRSIHVEHCGTALFIVASKFVLKLAFKGYTVAP
eukprot:1340961-Amphidinium_carterae.2